MGSTIPSQFQSIDSTRRKTFASTNADFHRWMGHSNTSSRGLVEGNRNLLFDLVEKVFGHRLDRRGISVDREESVVCLSGNLPSPVVFRATVLNISRTMFFYSAKFANNSIARAKIDRICWLSREILISTNVFEQQSPLRLEQAQDANESSRWIWKERRKTWIGSTSSLRTPSSFVIPD